MIMRRLETSWYKSGDSKFVNLEVKEKTINTLANFEVKGGRIYLQTFSKGRQTVDLQTLGKRGNTKNICKPWLKEGEAIHLQPSGKRGETSSAIKVCYGSIWTWATNSVVCFRSSLVPQSLPQRVAPLGQTSSLYLARSR